MSAYSYLPSVEQAKDRLRAIIHADRKAQPEGRWLRTGRRREGATSWQNFGFFVIPAVNYRPVYRWKHPA